VTLKLSAFAPVPVPAPTDAVVGVVGGNSNAQYTFQNVFLQFGAVTFDQAPAEKISLVATDPIDTCRFASFDTTWLPSNLAANLVAWYKADAGVYHDAGVTLATNGQTVWQWNDQSGNGYHLVQATSAKRPTLTTAGIGGNRSIQFSNTFPGEQWLQTALAAVGFHGTACSGFMVLESQWQQNTMDPTAGRLWSIAHGNQVTDDFTSPSFAVGFSFTFLSGALTAAPVLGVFCSQQIGNGGAGISVPDQTPIRHGVIFDGSHGNTYFDDVVQGTGTSFTTSLGDALGNTLTVGASVFDTTFFNGLISELVFFNRALTTSEIFQLDSYFNTKWNLW
jgi:hypothetical protein